MQSPALHFLNRTIVSAGIATTLLMTAVRPLPAQNTVPASAAGAAKMPQFASRLRPAAKPRASYKKPARTLALPNGKWLPPDGIVYTNGPIDGENNAWTINFGFIVSDTFTDSAGGAVDGISFGAWLLPGDVLVSAEVSITSNPDGGTLYFDQILNFTESNCFLNNAGFNVCSETSGTFANAPLSPGTYWVNLKNAITSTGDPVYWDENDGPSQAYQNSVGTIPSESFTITGEGGSPTCFSPQGNLQVLFDFTQQQGGGNGVVMDHAGNLYGTNPSGGNHSNGFAFKLSDFGSWILNPLFNFLGGDSGGEPTGTILGPNGSLYGGAGGGIQNCGSDGTQYCGLVYNLRPKPTVCASASCGWNNDVLYRFTRESDGSGTINASSFDQAGNLYGTTTTGGANGQGTIFELTPSGGGWMKTTLYSFTGHNDGTGPTQVLAGSDGNLYGLAAGGFFNEGVVFQLTPSGGQWIESTVYPFGREGDYQPGSLVQDSAGNLYGIASKNAAWGSAVIFRLKKTVPGWTFSQYIVVHNEFDTLVNMTIDASGNLYGTGFDRSTFAGSRQGKVPGGGTVTYDSYIFKASNDSNGWHYQDLKYLPFEYFLTRGSLVVDSGGNLYGTTYQCQAPNYGTVWKLSP